MTQQTVVATEAATQAVAQSLEVVSHAPKGTDPVLQKMAITRFQASFSLEGELIGMGKMTTSKKGKVTLKLKALSAKDGSGLDVATGLKGVQLEAKRQQLAQAFKTELGVYASRLTSDKNYEAGSAVMQPNGSVVLEWKPVKEEVLQVVSAKAAMASLGITEDEMAAIELARDQKAIEAKAKSEEAKTAELAKLKAEAVAQAKAELAAEALAASATSNGAVTGDAPSDADDSKSMTE